ncbi:MAG: multicopper oxidase domain-containing protein, partial [Gemmatimonadota bacterium]
LHAARCTLHLARCTGRTVFPKIPLTAYRTLLTRSPMNSRYASLLVGLLSLTIRPRPTPPVERIAANDNRSAAGVLQDGVLTISLETRAGNWFPQADSGGSELMQSFGETGKPLQIPGPLVRVPVGTLVRATIHNSTEAPLTLHGLVSRPAAGADSVIVDPNGTAHIEFTLKQAGTFAYWGSTTGSDLEDRKGIDSQLSGAIVVDSGDIRSDRVFVLGVWGVPIDSSGPKPWVPRDVMVINGKMWPFTERFSYTQGDSVHWRWVNPTADAHPMHLHGFFFSVESAGDGMTDTTFAPGNRRDVVTELMLPGGTMSLSWLAARPGNWLFHCHFAFHVSHYLSLERIPDPVDPGAADAVDHSVHGMTGLVLGLQVKARPGSVTETRSPTPTRRLHLFVRAVPKTAVREELYAFVVRGDGIRREDSTDPTLILRKDQPVEITVVNELRAPTSVHWHGIEVQDSYVDGVPGWSGTNDHLAPLIAPGDSFRVEFTPTRQGTYMYHSHSNEEHQIGNGLYAPILVMNDPTTFDRTRDRVFILGGEGEDGRINRQAHPDTSFMTVGTTYRVRVIQIQPDRRVVFSMQSPRGNISWRAVAKDGAELPSGQSATRPARVIMGPGETEDFLFTPSAPGDLSFVAGSALGSTWRVVAPIKVSGER